MAFESLTDKLQNAFKNLRSKGALTEEDVKAALHSLYRESAGRFFRLHQSLPIRRAWCRGANDSLCRRTNRWHMAFLRLLQINRSLYVNCV